MDAEHFREKAEVLVRLADDVSLNDSGRLKLMELAEDLKKRAIELEAETTLQPRQYQSENVEYQNGRSQMSTFTRTNGGG